MDITPLLRQDTNIIQSYKNGVFRVNGMNYAHTILISGDYISPITNVDLFLQQLDSPAQAGFHPDIDPSLRWGSEIKEWDVLLYGTGATQIWPPAALRARVNMEVMTTPAACRTYNALISEGRNVLAILEVCAAN